MKKQRKTQTRVVGKVVASIDQAIDLILSKQKPTEEQLLDVLSQARDVVVALSNAAATNSSNSSKSPSKDPHRKRTTKAKGKKRKPGGQNGHKGSRLKPVENPTIVEKIEIDRTSLPPGEYASAGFEARQVIDIEVSVVVTEYQAEVLKDRTETRGLQIFRQELPNQLNMALP